VKKFINRPEHVVEEMLQGLTVLNPRLARLAGHKVMFRHDAEQVHGQQVAIISGGGSGHEPAHAGYVGAGMLSAAVAGEIFTSPDSESVLAAILAVAGAPGALLVIKNYTGDRLNFGVAAEMARSEGIPVETIIVNDDVALLGKAPITGARGLAGTVFIHKLVGAAAAEGRSLLEIASFGKEAIESLGTMSVSFSAGTSPAVGKPSFELDANEMELGLGIHGEPGRSRGRLQPADDLTETLLAEILTHREFGPEKRLAVMINNLGATTEMELAIVARRAFDFLQGSGYAVERIYAGTFLSSLDMAGISISLLGLNDLRLSWLDAPTGAAAWPNVPKQRPNLGPHTASAISSPTAPGEVKTETGKRVKRAIESACGALLSAEAALTEMDRVTGDGDLGASMKRAALAVRSAIDSFPLDDVPATFRTLGRLLQRELGGSSGPFYGVFFLRAGNALNRNGATTATQWADALEEGCQAISELGGAKPGDRTMLDALGPFVESMKAGAAEGLHTAEILHKAVEDARRGADSTSQMMPRLGRSSYLGQRALGHPDPGAAAVAIWLRASAAAILA
jgi:triose/dihydroxyacetone kinase / FAD-AMP lyase (cyclizing)